MGACLRLQLRREERKVTITAGKDKIKRQCGVSSQTVAGAPGDLFSRLIFTAKALGSASCRRLPNAQKSCGDSVELSIIILAPCPCLEKATEADGEDDEGEERVNVKDAAASPARSAKPNPIQSIAVTAPADINSNFLCLAPPCLASPAKLQSGSPSRHLPASQLASQRPPAPSSG